MSVALGVKVHEDLPPMLMQQESDSVWTQIRELPVTRCMSMTNQESLPDQVPLVRSCMRSCSRC